MTAPALSIDRLFQDPPLAGKLLQQPRFSPDGSILAFLLPGADDARRLDLWSMPADGSAPASELVRASSLDQGGRELSAVEQAHRERKRIFVGGIVDYSWVPAAKGVGNRLLLPMAGRLWLYHLADGSVQALTPEQQFATDAQFSSCGQHLCYVADRCLYRLDLGRLASGTTPAPVTLLAPATDTQSCGLAEFVAQEEMHRMQGYWWGPDSRSLACTRVDESPIPVTWRSEIAADEITMVAQRYPFAGATNAAVELLLLDPLDPQADERSIDWSDNGRFEYLARVTWLPESGAGLLLQRQSRDQQVLELVHWNPADGSLRVLLAETSATWVNLHDNLHPLADGRFLWSSERDGWSHLYLYQGNGELQGQLTAGSWRMDSLLGVHNNNILFSGWTSTATEQHLHRLALPGADSRFSPVTNPDQLTREPGWHSIGVAADGKTFVDLHSALGQPATVALRSTSDGAELAQVMANSLSPGHPWYPWSPLADPTAPIQQLGTLVADDGQELRYRMTLPAGYRDGPPLPVVVNVYGGPGVSRVKNEWAPLWYQFLARQGYIVFELDNRGASYHSKGFEDPIFHLQGQVEVADQATGVAFLHSLPWVDRKRVAIQGHSYGGYMALLCLARHPQLFRCAVAVALVTDWALYDSHYTERYLGTPQGNPEGYEQSSVFPWLHGLPAGGLHGRLLLMHGMADDNVLFTHATRLYRALQDADIPFETMNYPGEKHGLAGRATSIHRHKAIFGFLQRNLGGDIST